MTETPIIDIKKHLGSSTLLASKIDHPTLALLLTHRPGLDEAMIRRYIQEQEKHERDQERGLFDDEE